MLLALHPSFSPDISALLFKDSTSSVFRSTSIDFLFWVLNSQKCIKGTTSYQTAAASERFGSRTEIIRLVVSVLLCIAAAGTAEQMIDDSKAGGGGGGGGGGQWQWENAAAGSIAGFATVAVMHPLDVVRTRFQVNDGRILNLPTYKNTPHALLTIARSEGLRGLYAGFYPAVLGSSVSWGLFFFFYSRAKQRYSHKAEEKLSPGCHLAAAAEAGALVSFCTNPVWLIKTRLQLQTPLHQTRQYSGVYDALRTILREEGWTALYRGIWPSLFLVSHGAIQFTVYEELRKFLVDLKSKRTKREGADEVLNSVDYTVLGASSKVAAILCTYPFQVIRARLQQRPNADGVPRYADTLHVVKETGRFEGIRGFYKGITANLLKNVPASAVTFVVYENVLKLFKLTRTRDH